MLKSSKLESFDLIQHVSQPMHSRGHLLDLIMTRSTDHLVEEMEVKDMHISDHFWFHCNLLGQKPKTFRKEITFRKMKALDAIGGL